MRLIFTIRSKRSRFEAHLQKTVKKSKKEQILRPIYKNGRGADFEAHLKKRVKSTSYRSTVINAFL